MANNPVPRPSQLERSSSSRAKSHRRSALIADADAIATAEREVYPAPRAGREVPAY